MHLFSRWLVANGVFLDSRICLVSRPEASIAVDALAPIAAHETRKSLRLSSPLASSCAYRLPDLLTVARIPVSLVLSHRSSALARSLKGTPDPLAAHPPALRLAVHVAHELSLGTHSRWATYLEYCPRRAVSIALLWEGEARRWIRGTELERECARIGVDGPGLKRFYDTVAQPLLSSLPSTSAAPIAPPSIATFAHAYTLVSSRAFQVSAFHPLALVPLADAFNHSDPPHVHMASDAWVCPECGRLDACPHDDGEHVPADRDAGDDTVDMVSERAIEPGDEVFNTYGAALSNAHLVAAYGFLSEGNEHDVVTFYARDALETLAHLGAASCAPTPNVTGLDALERALRVLGAEWRAAGLDAASLQEDHPLLAPFGARPSLDCFIDADARLSPGLWLVIALSAWRSASRERDAHEVEPPRVKRPRLAAGSGSQSDRPSVRDVVRLAELAAEASRRGGEGSEEDVASSETGAEPGRFAPLDWIADDYEREALRWAGCAVRTLGTKRLEQQAEEARGMSVTALYELAEETEDPSLRLAIEFLAGERLLLERVSSQWTFL